MRIRSTRRPPGRDGASPRTTRKARRATSARRRSIGKRRRVSCGCVRAAGRRASRTCRAWRSRRRFWSRSAEENNLGDKAFDERWDRWDTCGLCEQQYHGVVSCALGWACWKACVGRAGEDLARRSTRCNSLGTDYAYKTLRGRVVRGRGPVVYASAPWHIRTKHPRAEQYCAHVSIAGGRNRL